MEFDKVNSGTDRWTGERGASSRGAVRLVTGNAGDHTLVYELLRAANLARTHEDFSAWLEEPSYEPSDRLLVKRGGQIVSHVQVLDRTAWFGGTILPASFLRDLASLPEHADAGYERLLLSAAEQRMRSGGAVLAFAHTSRPELFSASGWHDLGPPRHTEANVHDVLVRLGATPAVRERRPLKIRLWRQVELDALRTVYRHGAAASWGALDRSEPYWRWLVGCRAHDALIVAIDGQDAWDELEKPSHIVGYAATRGSQVLELFTLDGFERAAQPLLVRACQDAIEQGQRSLTLHAAANDPLHEYLLSGGGNWTTNGRNGNGTLLVKLLDPFRWIEGLFTVLLERARKAGTRLPCRFVFHAGRRTLRFELTSHGSLLASGDERGNFDIVCTRDTLDGIFLGTIEATSTSQAGGIEIPDQETAIQLAALFPRQAFWQSQLDTQER